MKNKLLATVLSVVMILGIVGCTPKDPTSSGDAEGENYKIGIITGTVSQGEEEYRAAEAMKEKYGDKIILQTYPDSFMKEQETTIANTLTLAADPDVKAIVFVQAVPGASAAIDKVREKNPDMLFIAGVPGEDPAMIAGKADVVLAADELGMGKTIVEQAKKQGAKTLVHYSFPRHMSYEMLAKRRELLKETCTELGLEFVDATAPDPTGDAGVPGAQQFILEDVPRKVAEYGKETAFFSTNCSMQEPLIKSVLTEGAILPQQCCPSPYHAYPAALGIEIPDDKKGDVNYIIEEITDKIKEKGGEGRFSTWPIPVNMLMVECGTEYAIAYIEGKTNGRNDKEKLTEILNDSVEGKITINPYTDEGTKTLYENYYLILSDYINF
ncbi:MAG: DUF3798 domain-containing protein [Clostridium sp.]